MTVNMQHESERLEALCTQEAQQISRLTEVLDLINSFDERTRPDAVNPLRLEECAELFTKLQVSRVVGECIGKTLECSA